jgi:hypothetical protein
MAAFEKACEFMYLENVLSYLEKPNPECR